MFCHYRVNIFLSNTKSIFVRCQRFLTDFRSEQWGKFLGKANFGCIFRGFSARRRKVGEGDQFLERNVQNQVMINRAGEWTNFYSNETLLFRTRRWYGLRQFAYIVDTRRTWFQGNLLHQRRNHKNLLFCQKWVVTDIRTLFTKSILALIQAKFSALIIILSVAGVIIAATTTFCCFMLKRRQKREGERNAFIQKLVRIVW
jgi:hypothetical protein